MAFVAICLKTLESLVETGGFSLLLLLFLLFFRMFFGLVLVCGGWCIFRVVWWVLCVGL